MGSISNAGFPGRARWTLAGLLRRFQPAPRARAIAVSAQTETETETPRIRTRRHYPAQRDLTLERAAMAREMFRL